MKPLAQRALVLAALLATLAGCYHTDTSFAPHREIEAIGVVASYKMLVVGSSLEEIFTFDDGRTYTLTSLPSEGNHFSGTAPSAGDLLIAGSKPRPWGMVAHPQDSGWPEGCYLTTDYTVEEHDTTVDLDIGVTLQKAPNFQPRGLSPGQRVVAKMCLDRQGRIMEIYFGGV